jgi:hypothetical protein
MRSPSLSRFRSRTLIETMTMGYDRDAKKAVLKTCSGRLATIPVLDPDLNKAPPGRERVFYSHRV